VALYSYVKAPVKIKVVKRKSFRSNRLARHSVLRFIPYGLVVAGIALITNALMPIFVYQLQATNYTQRLIAPIANFNTPPITNTELTALGNEPGEVDYLKPDNWFPAAPVLPLHPSKITHYNITIPKLKIKEAIVEIDGKDLGNSMVQYPGTAVPGQLGNTVIFCHSVLPQFFDPRNYRTICSTLPTLKDGDQVSVYFDGITYLYKVVEMVEVPPNDVTILEQHYDNSYLSLITCVPPGTYLRRLVVQARLIAQ